MIQTDTLKPGWQIWRFDEMATNVNDRINDPSKSETEYYVGLEHLDSDSLKIRRWGSPSDVEATKLCFRKGDIIFGRRRVYQRKVAVADFDGICSAHALVLRAKPEVVKPEFLPFFMQSDLFMERAKAISVGSLSPTINWKTLAKEEFALPPIEEQRRIAEILPTIVQSIYKYDQLLKASQVMVQSYIESIFNLQKVRSLLKNKTDIKNLGFIELGKLCSLQVGYPFKSSGYTSTGDRLLRCSNVGIDALEWQPDKTRFWSSECKKEFREYVLSTEDIVVAMDRPFVGTGFKVAKVSDSDLPALLLQRVGRFILSDKIDREFLWCFLHSMSIQFQLKGQQQGTDLPHISKFDIEGTILPEIPLEEQKAIGARYQEWTSVVQKVRTRLSFLKELQSQLIRKVLF